jgi:hypothetical protein
MRLADMSLLRAPGFFQPVIEAEAANHVFIMARLRILAEFTEEKLQVLRRSGWRD